jgi:hypothetical protein
VDVSSGGHCCFVYLFLCGWSVVGLYFFIFDIARYRLSDSSSKHDVEGSGCDVGCSSPDSRLVKAKRELKAKDDRFRLGISSFFSTISLAAARNTSIPL